MEQSVSGNLGAATAGVVDVVALHGDHVVGSIKVNGPVVVVVTSCRVRTVTVDVVVGNAHTAGRLSAQDDVLTSDEGGLFRSDISLYSLDMRC